MPWSLVPDPDVTFGPFSTDDVVSSSTDIPYETEDGTPASLDHFTSSETVLVHPDGTTSPVLSGIVDDGTGRDVLAVTLVGQEFDEPGEWTVSPKLIDSVTAGGLSVRVPGIGFVVEDVSSGWLTLHQIRQEWRDAPSSDVVLYRLLEIAKTQVIAYTPEPAPARPTPNLVGAQREQARDVWNQTKTDPASIGIGDDVLTIRPFPMSPWIKDMIRPKQAKPVIA